MTTTPPPRVTGVEMMNVVSIKVQHANAKKMASRKRYGYGTLPCTFDRQPFDATMLIRESYSADDVMGSISISEIEEDADCEFESLFDEAVGARSAKKRCLGFAYSNVNKNRQDEK
tara:strand:- start:74 stop:421 length:348 start_codon:yes stop_codon:yes gene_type:complete